MKRIASHLFAALLALTTMACSNGVQEFQVYSTAFDLQNETAQKVLDKVASAERAHWEHLHDGKNPLKEFNPDDAAYYINVGDPPLAGSMRKTLKALTTYNRALTGLANGESADALTAKISTIVTDLSGAQEDLAHVANLGVAVTIPTPVKGYLGTAKTIFGTALRGAARQSFRENLIRAYPTLKQILLTFRDGTPELYYLVISVPKRVPREQMLKDRDLFASWVLLIDSTIKTMEIAVKAAMQNGPRADIDALAESSIELRILAEKIRVEQNR